MNFAANEVYAEDGVSVYSVVRVGRTMPCDICHQDAPETAELCRTEIYEDGGRGSRRWDALNICAGCAYRVGGLFDTHNAGKELFNGVLQDRADGVE
ncbi:MAG TPA: hypothetical protein VLJ61_13795 [Pyrinomonadaceae bacterium]|nr:hypothetical protein [Pyrinomonadaceae bacterium]